MRLYHSDIFSLKTVVLIGVKQEEGHHTGSTMEIVFRATQTWPGPVLHLSLKDPVRLSVWCVVFLGLLPLLNPFPHVKWNESLISKAPLQVKAYLAQSSEGWHSLSSHLLCSSPWEGFNSLGRALWLGQCPLQDFKKGSTTAQDDKAGTRRRTEEERQGQETSGERIFGCSSMSSLDHPERPSNSSDLTAGFNNSWHKALTEVKCEVQSLSSRWGSWKD